MSDHNTPTVALIEEIIKDLALQYRIENLHINFHKDPFQSQLEHDYELAILYIREKAMLRKQRECKHLFIKDSFSFGEWNLRCYNCDKRESCRNENLYKYDILSKQQLDCLNM